MQLEKAYYVGTHPCAFRSGEAAEIVGIEMVRPDAATRVLRAAEWCECFRLKYGDGQTDLVPVWDRDNYSIIRAGQVRPGFVTFGPAKS